MAGVNWGGIANSGFDAFGNFQGGWEVGSSSGTGYETFTNILNLAGQVAPTLGHGAYGGRAHQARPEEQCSRIEYGVVLVEVSPNQHARDKRGVGIGVLD